jgi:biopolymer transport protein ExbD
MAMQTGDRKDDEPTAEINTTPLIDVMLVLLIMLIVTLPAPRHAIKLDTPQQSKEPFDHPLRPVSIAIDFDGSIAWNGAPIEVADLDGRLKVEAAHDPQAEIHIVPHRLTKYGHVAHVMALAQRDGLTKLGVVGGT